MGEYKTPGVYIKEKNAFGNSVVEAETAIPAFIGITEKAENGNDDLTLMPWKISSMTEFITYFGDAPEFEFEVDIKDTVNLDTSNFYHYDIKENIKEEGEKIYSFQLNLNRELDGIKTPYYSLFRHMQMFFANGGGACYVVSIGSYKDKVAIDSKNAVKGELKVEAAFNALEKIREVTMILVPEAVESTSYAIIQQMMMKHCGKMANRFAILDVPSEPTTIPLNKRMEMFQDTVTGYFSYGAAYFPWLNASVVSERDFDGKMFIWKEGIFTYMKKFAHVDKNFPDIISSLSTSEIMLNKPKEGEEEEKIIIKGHTFTFSNVEKEEDIYADSDKEKKIGKIIEVQETETGKTVRIRWYALNDEERQTLHQALLNSSSLYKEAIKSLIRKLNLLPPSAAIAGIYTRVDHNRGVWKAPANVTLNYVNSPAEDIDDDKQADLNAPMNGKAINVIRTFRGEGVKVWGARTLDGNSLDWRYVNVRRTLLFLEESVRNAARAYVFEPNDAGTWINMKCMIENFLRSVWKRGGLAGATPEAAYEVHVGLGDTMTGEDILEGIMRITILVAVTHPAEFIEITFQQQMQKS